MPTPRRTKTAPAPAAPAVNIGDIGEDVGHIDVTIGPQFLNLFSEHLYSSPNKAFEELVSNSWDAGATVTYVHLPQNLKSPNAAVWVLDNGASMDVSGLRKLWHVGTSIKRSAPDGTEHGRAQIGKFGIGKLATYILAHQLTYICRASDKRIRAVTMDYTRIDRAAAQGELHIDPLPLTVRELDRQALSKILKPLGIEPKVMPLLDAEVPVPSKKKDRTNEFGHPDDTPPVPTGTWTLVIMASLKQAGQEMQVGWIRRMLRASLPLGPSMEVVFNGDQLTGLRSDVKVAKQWSIGVDLGLTEFAIEDEGTDGEEKFAVTTKTDPFPHILVEGLSGPITGTVYLYEDKISGGKSEQMGPSNGFFVNVLGRVINAEDVDFGLSNLSHSAWAKFRACVRADGLDKALAITREDIKKTNEVRIFKAFLMALFNIARNEENRLSRAGWPNAGQILSDTWAAIPLEPLRKIISDRIGSTVGFPSFVRVDPKVDPNLLQREWDEATKDRSGKIIENVVFEALGPEEPLGQYDVQMRSIVVNKNHPFTLEHCESREDQEFVRNVAVVDLLTDSYIAEVGVEEEQHSQIREYRDQILRLLAQLNRKSGAMIAGLLAEATTSVKGLEKIVGDALRYLGFVIEPLGQPGQPEGIATAPLPPAPGRHQSRSSYSFTYDAKSTKHRKVATGNVKVSGLARHRDDKTADFALVVGPDFVVAKALLKECAAGNITPMRAHDLATLVMLTAANGSLDLDDFRNIFELRNPDEVHEWVEELKVRLEKNKPAFSLELFFEALDVIGFDGPNAVSASVIAEKISDITSKKNRPKVPDVTAVVRGLMVLVPSLVRLTSKDDIQFSTSPKGLREALIKQINVVPNEFRFGYMKGIV